MFYTTVFCPNISLLVRYFLSLFVSTHVRGGVCPPLGCQKRREERFDWLRCRNPDMMKMFETQVTSAKSTACEVRNRRGDLTH